MDDSKVDFQEYSSLSQSQKMLSLIRLHGLKDEENASKIRWKNNMESIGEMVTIDSQAPIGSVRIQ